MHGSDVAIWLTVAFSIVLLSVAAIAHLALYPYASERTVVRWLLPVMALPVLGPLAWFGYALATALRVHFAVSRLVRSPDA